MHLSHLFLKGKKLLNTVVLCNSLLLFQNVFAHVDHSARKPEAIDNYFNKYAEIKLNNDQSTVRVLGTINTSHHGFEGFIEVSNGLLEAVKDPKTLSAFNGSELFLINVGDYPEVMPYTSGRSPFLTDVGENYRGGGLGDMIYQSEEFICKMGVLTRYHKGVDDYAVRRWDNPIHEIGHWIEIHGNHRDSILNSSDFKNLPQFWQQGGIDEVFTILVTAWFDAQYSYMDMPKNREQFKNTFPKYYTLFQTIFNESTRNIGQYCANEQELKGLDQLSEDQKSKTINQLFSPFPKSIISKTGNKVPNSIQKQDNLYNPDYSYVIDDKVCSLSLNSFSRFSDSNVNSCASYCDENSSCNRFGFNTETKECKLFEAYDCLDSQELNPNIAVEFEYKKMSQIHHESKTANRLTAYEHLNVNEKLCSNNKKFMLDFQSDGNLCLYQAGFENKKEFVWCSMTTEFGQNHLKGMTMQTDGKLALYNNKYQQPLTYLGPTQPDNHNSGYTAILQNDRNFGIYDAHHKQVWSSQTTQSKSNQTIYSFTDC